MSNVHTETLRTQPLENVARFIRGITFTPDDKVDPGTKGSAICMRTANVQNLLDESDLIAVPLEFVKRDEQFLMESDILVSTANSWNLVGKCSWVPKLSYRATAGGFISILRADRSKVFPRYLYYWFASDQTQHDVRLCGRQTTNISNMSYERCLALEIPLPPLSEQKRIADILDKADAIRRKRQEAIDILESSKAAAFHDIFGDPIQNSKNWARQPLGELLECIDSGVSPRCLDRPVSSGEWGILKLGAVTWCEYDWTQNKALPDTFAPDPSIEVKQGDLLFTRKNTYELVAATTFVYQTPPKLMLPDLIFRLRLRSDAPILPEFLWGLLTYPSKRRQVQTLAGGAAGSMPNISKAKLLQHLVEVPPINVQASYARLLHQVHKTRHRNDTSKDASDNLFNSLVQRAFKGEL